MLRQYQKGFSYVELLVVVSVISVITVFVFVRQAAYDSTTLLNNLTYEMALTIREAQAYGISVRNTGQGFDTAYGVHFSDSTTNNENMRYVFFQDLDGEEDYDAGTLEHIDTYNLGRGHTIDDVCITVGTNTEDCSISELTVLFKRPKPDAIINRFSNADGRVTVESRGGSQRSIDVFTTGQIAVVTPNAAPPSDECPNVNGVQTTQPCADTLCGPTESWSLSNQQCESLPDLCPNVTGIQTTLPCADTQCVPPQTWSVVNQQCQGGGTGGPSYTWQSIGTSCTFWPFPQVTQGQSCSSPGSTGYGSITNWCALFVGRYNAYRCQ